MKSMAIYCVSIGLLFSNALSFEHHTLVASRKNPLGFQAGRQQSRLHQATPDEDSISPLMPKTSFGADAVPEGQRPVNEYLEILGQPFFKWAALESGDKGLLIRMLIVYGVSFPLICFPIAGATFTQDGFLLQKLAASNVGSLALVLFFLIRMYSGWGYVGARLNSDIIEYEETGWYDGDFERKSQAEKMRDELLYEESVKPVVDRVKLFSFSCALLWIFSCAGLNFALSAKPRFDEYNPAMLERLRYDEKLAGVAAEQSYGRPTYCDSRYYKAVAGGGQGCK